MRRHLLLLIFVGSIMSSLALAQTDAGLVAYNAGDYATALSEWQALAARGSAAAQFNIGLLYFTGRGVAEDRTEAASWYLRAADAGYARAQYELAQLYEKGEGVERDLVQAHKWFNLAADGRYQDARKRRKRVAKQLTPKQISFAEMHARHWRAEVKQKGN